MRVNEALFINVFNGQKLARGAESDEKVILKASGNTVKVFSKTR